MLCCKRRGQSSHEIVRRIRSVSESRGGTMAGGQDGRLDYGAEVQLRANSLLLQLSQWKSPGSN